MLGKLSDSNLRYFEAISENKRKENALRREESKIDDLKKKMLTKYWKDKIGVFDEMIRLNVKTPTYDCEHSGRSSSNSMTMGSVAIDSKLLSGRPVTLQKGSKGASRVEPVINIEGTDAVCYPNKEAKRGRRVELNKQTLRRIEQCKTLEDNIASIRVQSARRDVALPGWPQNVQNLHPDRRVRRVPNDRRSKTTVTSHRVRLPWRPRIDVKVL